MASPSVARTRRVPANIESDDAFAMRAAEVGDWAKRNIRRIMMVAGALATVLLLAIGYFLLQARKNAAASAEYLQVQANTAPGPQGIQQLERFVAQYGGTNEGHEARLQLAGLYLDANQAAKALPHAREVASSGGVLEYQGQMMLGAVLTRTNDRNGALQAYRDAAASTRIDFQRAEALSQAALLNETAGQWQAAVDLYREMLKDTEEGSMDRSIVEMRLAEAEARLPAARR
ncbi:MAG TPA: tetratricopeptide repeat protein [Longimicrobium sp.]|jgi:predicted negative regulator of RcsB-dependent stress response